MANNKSINKLIKVSAIALGTAFTVMEVVAKRKKADSVYENEPEQKNPMEGKKVEFIADENDKENADGVKGHLVANGKSEHNQGIYEKFVKRGLDVALSFGGLVLLSPVLGTIALAIKIDDPGPVLFTQKRVGQNKKYFKLHKFRSMKMSTPHDVPTHMLENPDQYITKVGKFIRAHSLDELPQIWDIFIGNMSVIGPRPALWNQDLLTSERDKYGANDVKPGLTGWAQINGRDELEIAEKARLDGVYVQKMGLKMDTKVFMGSLHVFRDDESVVEGGTGTIHRESQEICRYYTNNKSSAELIGHIGFDEPVEVDQTAKKRVLITGAGSYIGETFKTYAEKNYCSNFSIDTLDMLNPSWRNYDFSAYDVVYHVAGLAHADVGNVSDETKEKYYAVNTDLAVEVCKKAKEEGVKEFIFMSSMIVYGDSAPYGVKKIINEDTIPLPANFYGDSKLQADVAVRELASDNFKVLVLRPPMIYGKGSKGNYPILAKLAKRLPVFPEVNNERSMLYIGNLCEFLCQIMLVKEIKKNSVVLIPQNPEWTNTTDMVRKIAKSNNHKIFVSKVWKPAVVLAGKVPGKIGRLVDKAFGNNVYSQDISYYEGLDYQNFDMSKSVEETEGQTKMKKRILFLVNHDVVIYNFRLELVERLLHDGYEVHISSPYGERIDDLVKLGAIWHEINVDRHGINPVHEFKLFQTYRKLMAEVKPDFVLGYTIKPNIYGAMAAGEKDIPFIANITGLGTAVENPGITQKVAIELYKVAFRKVRRVFFQNKENQQFFINHNIAIGKHDLLPGSGVNLERFPYQEYPNDCVVKFVFIGRIMKEKGIDYFLSAAEYIHEKYPNTEFHVCGFLEDEYKGKLDEYVNKGLINYHGMVRDIGAIHKEMHCTVFPSYYPEGLSNVLLEAAASGRPIITTDRPGCREAIDDGVSGILIPVKDQVALDEAMDRFMQMTTEERRMMGKAGRAKVEKEFDRQIVVEKYMEEINKEEYTNE